MPLKGNKHVIFKSCTCIYVNFMNVYFFIISNNAEIIFNIMPLIRKIIVVTVLDEGDR